MNEAVNSLPLASQKVGSKIRALRVPGEITVHSADGTGRNGLHIYPKAHRIGKAVDPNYYLIDAKKIFAWLVWHLPAGTVEELIKLLNSKEA
jgi:hypothetical protein